MCKRVAKSESSPDYGNLAPPPRLKQPVPPLRLPLQRAEEEGPVCPWDGVRTRPMTFGEVVARPRPGVRVRPLCCPFSVAGRSLVTVAMSAPWGLATRRSREDQGRRETVRRRRSIDDVIQCYAELGPYPLRTVRTHESVNVCDLNV